MATELMVRDVMPELEQAVDIPARIKAVRTQPAQLEPTRFALQPGTVFMFDSGGATSSTSFYSTTTRLSGGWGLQQQQGLLSQAYRVFQTFLEGNSHDQH